MDAGQWNGRPGYRPPMAAGQQYPPLGYAPDGGARYAYTPEPGAEFPQEQPEIVVEPGQVPPSNTPPSNSPQRLAWGVVSVVALVLVVAGGLKFMSGGGSDDPPPRAEPPASQNIDDPYLPKSITPTETVPGESRTPSPRNSLEAVLSVDAAPGSTVIYFNNGRVQLDFMDSSHWEQKVVTTPGLLRINVVARAGAAASCTITVDGAPVAHEEIPEGDPSGAVVCRAAG
ncbi:MAG: hypothetical protein LBE07_05600 [Gordonia sp. (in: high G+C Gram-positive bacteria)]|nr:hypothetical protein [Gordonia sp. (in: high G+C Gram-positive bacteria)]